MDDLDPHFARKLHPELRWPVKDAHRELGRLCISDCNAGTCARRNIQTLDKARRCDAALHEEQQGRPTGGKLIYLDFDLIGTRGRMVVNGTGVSWLQKPSS